MHLKVLCQTYKYFFCPKKSSSPCFPTTDETDKIAHNGTKITLNSAACDGLTTTKQQVSSCRLDKPFLVVVHYITLAVLEVVKIKRKSERESRNAIYLCLFSSSMPF